MKFRIFKKYNAISKRANKIEKRWKRFVGFSRYFSVWTSVSESRISIFFNMRNDLKNISILKEIEVAKVRLNLAGKRI